MNLGLIGEKRLEEKVTITITQKDLLLLKLCLELVDKNHTSGGILRFDIQSLRDKLSVEQ